MPRGRDLQGDRDSKEAAEDIVVRELPLTIMLNGRELCNFAVLSGKSEIYGHRLPCFGRAIEFQERYLKHHVNEQKGIAHIQTAADFERRGRTGFLTDHHTRVRERSRHSTARRMRSECAK